MRWQGGTLSMGLRVLFAHVNDVLDAMTTGERYLNAAFKSTVKIDEKTEQFGLPVGLSDRKIYP